MEFRKNEESKIYEIWMTGADQLDEACNAQVKELSAKWHSMGWTPVIYKSGKEDLEELTSALLITNRDRAARRDVERQRMAKEEPRLSAQEMLLQKPEPVKKKVRRKRDEISL